MTSPTQRAREFCKSQGWTSAIVEHWNMHAKIRQDLFGCFDMVVLDGQPGLLGVQVSSGAHHADRMAKLRAAEVMPAWLRAGCRAEVWTFTKHKARKQDGSYSKLYKWDMRREAVTAC